MANPNESTNDLLRVFETDSSIAPSMTAATTTSAPVNNVSSNILGEINAATNYQEEELLQILSDNNNAPRGSNRRSSILKVNEKVIPDFRRNSRRVSWAQTYQFKEVRSDGTMVITSQELNKFGSEPPTALKSAGFDVNQHNENAAPNAQSEQQAKQRNSILTAPMAPSPVIDDPVQELANLEVLQKVKEKVKNNKSYTRILSKYYNKEDEKDRQTVIHTAVNRFGIDIDPTTTTDLNCLFDAVNPKKPDLLNNSDNANLNNFVQQFVEQQKRQQQLVQVPSKPTTSTAASSHQLPSISPIAGNIKTNVRAIDDTMNMSTYQQVCNSTRIGTDQPSPEEYWISTAGKMGESMNVSSDKGTIHDTTMMEIDSSNSNDKESRSAAVSQPEEVSKDSSALLALLKGTNDEADMATDTLEFSFQQQQPTADEPQPSLGAILVGAIANNSGKENALFESKETVNQEDEEKQNDLQAPETDLMDILPSSDEEAPSVTANADTLMLPGDLTLGNILASGQTPTTAINPASSSASSGLTMDITMTSDIEGTLEPTNNSGGWRDVLTDDIANNSNKEISLFANNETASQEEDKAQNDRQAPETDLLDILPSSGEEAPSVTKNVDTLMLPSDLTLGNILASGQTPTSEISTSGGGLTMDITMTGDIESTLEPPADNSGQANNTDNENALFEGETASQEDKAPNDCQAPETDLMDILPSSGEEAPSVTKNADTLMLPSDLTLGNILASGQTPTAAIIPASDSTSGGLTMDVSMASDIESTLEPPANNSGRANNSNKENAVVASKETASQEEPPKPAIISPPSKRPYDFTMLDSMPEQQQQSKYIKRISSIPPRPITTIARAPVVERVVRKQIELDFNQPSISRSVDNSPNTSRGDSSMLNSQFTSLLAMSCVRKSIGFGLKERLIQRAQELQQHRENEARQQIELSTRDQAAPAAAVSEPAVAENDTQNDNSKMELNASAPMDFTEQSMSLADGTGEKRFSVKLRNSNAAVEAEPPSEPEPIAEEAQLEEEEEKNLDEAEKSNCFDISNFSMPDMSPESDGTSFKLDDFDDEIANSGDALGVDQAASGTGESSSEMNQLIGVVSQSIQNVNDEKMAEESPLNASTSPFNSTGYDIKKILDDTCEFTKFEDLSWLATESLNDFKEFASEDILYRCISSLDFNALHIRIHKMEPDTCEVRYLWGTLEVRIKFGAIKEERVDGSQVREMTFHLISLLSSKKAISYEVMRGLEEKALYDGDDMFLRYKEEHRPILKLAHNYVINRCDEEYHELIRKYPDSSKLLDLLHDLSNIVDTARKLCVELRHMHSREFMQILDPDSEDRFKFSIRLLGVRLVSHFQVHFTFDPMKYPFEVIRPEIVVPERDQHLYPIDQFKAALLLVKPGNFNYLTNLVQGARLFICALRKVLISNLKQQKQKAEMQSAKLLD